MDQVYGSSAMQQMVASAAISRHQENCYSNSSYGEEHACMRDPIFFQPIHPAFTGGIESYLDPKYAADPTAFASRLPYFPFSSAYGMYEYGFEPAFIRKRNERERQRVKCVNDGYARLREHLPDEYTEKRLSKVRTNNHECSWVKACSFLLTVLHTLLQITLLYRALKYFTVSDDISCLRSIKVLQQLICFEISINYKRCWINSWQTSMRSRVFSLRFTYGKILAKLSMLS